MDWCSSIISSIVSFIFIPFLDYFSDKVLKFDLSTISPHIIPIVLGFSSSVLLISYYILSIDNKMMTINEIFSSQF